MPISIRGINKGAGVSSAPPAPEPERKPVLPEPMLLNSKPEPESTGNTIAEELRIQAKLAAKFGAKVTITGAWVWAGFDHIPAESVRNELKANKWIWCRGKGKWAYRGKPSHSHKQMSWDYIVNKYGQESLEEENK